MRTMLISSTVESWCRLVRQLQLRVKQHNNTMPIYLYPMLDHRLPNLEYALLIAHQNMR